jgi:hypothetical protein
MRSVEGHEQPHPPQRKASLLDHLVCDGEVFDVDQPIGAAYVLLIKRQFYESGRYHSRVDIENRVSGIAFLVNDLAFLKPNNGRHNCEATAFVIGQQLVHSPG